MNGNQRRRQRQRALEGEQAAEQLAAEEQHQGPLGKPRELAPVRLFSPEQLRGLEEMRSQAPHLYGENRRGQSKNLLRRHPRTGSPFVLGEGRGQGSTTEHYHWDSITGSTTRRTAGADAEDTGPLRTPSILEEPVEQEQLALMNGEEGEEEQGARPDDCDLQVALQQGDQLVPVNGSGPTSHVTTTWT